MKEQDIEQIYSSMLYWDRINADSIEELKRTNFILIIVVGFLLGLEVFRWAY